LTVDNTNYLQTKSQKLNHMIDDNFGEIKSPLLSTPKERKNHSQDLFQYISFNKLDTQSMPYVTLTYAQSLDGSIALWSKKPIKLSGDESMKLTHKLRSNHDAILVGINTILTDNPSLNVRLIQGKSPQPIVLDSKLQFPLTSKLLTDNDPKNKFPTLPPWIFTDEKIDLKNNEHAKKLIQAGAKIFQIPTSNNQSQYLSIEHLLKSLVKLNISSVMVEGGASIIKSFLQSKLVNRVILTIAPIFVGGLRPISEKDEQSSFPRFTNVKQFSMGNDVILSVIPEWD